MTELKEDEEWKIEIESLENALIMYNCFVLSHADIQYRPTIRRFRVLYHSLKRFIEYLFDEGCPGPHEQHIRLKYQQMKQELECLRLELSIINKTDTTNAQNTSPVPTTIWKHGLKTNAQLKSPSIKQADTSFNSTISSTGNSPALATISIKSNPEFDSFKEKSNQLIKRNRELHTMKISSTFHKFVEKMKLHQLQAEFHSLRNLTGIKQQNIEAFQSLIDEQKNIVNGWEKKIRQFVESKKSTAENALKTLGSFIVHVNEDNSTRKKIHFVEELISAADPRTHPKNNETKSNAVKLPYLLNNNRMHSPEPRSHSAPLEL